VPKKEKEGEVGSNSSLLIMVDNSARNREKGQKEKDAKEQKSFKI